MKEAICNFCQNIETIDYEKHDLFGISKPSDSQIIKDDEGFHLWFGGGGDSFYAGVEVEFIHYCPVCGRKLDE